MKGFVKDIEDLALNNDDFRQVLYTTNNCQLVVMALKPKEDIGAEVHKLDQFFRVEQGSGQAVLDGVRTPIHAGFAVVVPAGLAQVNAATGSGSLGGTVTSCGVKSLMPRSTVSTCAWLPPVRR